MVRKHFRAPRAVPRDLQGLFHVVRNFQFVIVPTIRRGRALLVHHLTKDSVFVVYIVFVCVAYGGYPFDHCAPVPRVVPPTKCALYILQRASLLERERDARQGRGKQINLTSVPIENTSAHIRSTTSSFLLLISLLSHFFFSNQEPRTKKNQKK